MESRSARARSRLGPWRALRLVVLPALVAALAAWVLAVRSGVAKPHGDESGWISSSLHYTRLVLAGDLTWDKWRCDACQTWGAMNPHVGQWMIGFPLRIAATDRERDFSAFYDWDATYDENLRQGRVPPPGLLGKARAVSIVVGVLCCVLVYLIGLLAFHWAVGLAAALLVTLNPMFLDYAAVVGTDAPYNFFMLGLCLAVLLLLRRGRRTGFASRSALCGLLAGLAASVKPTGILVGGVLFTAAVLYLIAARSVSHRNAARALVAFTVSGLAVVYLLNPFFWPSLRVDWRDVPEEVGTLAGDLREGRFSGETWHERYPAVARLGRPLEFPLTLWRWKVLFDAIEDEKPQAWGGSRPLKIHERIFADLATIPRFAILLTLGVLILAADLLVSVRRGRPSPRAAVLLYFAVNYLFLVAFLRLDWGRYYLPTVIGACLVAPGGLYVLGEALWQRLRGVRIEPVTAGGPVR